jgi:hypothetical protein
MPEAVYVLCTLASAACAVLLARSYRRSGFRLLLWGALCFGGLALNSAMLFVDVVMVPTIDLSLWRTSVALAALLLLIFGLIWDSN